MEWLQNLVAWAQAHPMLSLGGAFALAIIECTVLIGLFVPGLGVMFCLGALVSLGALPLGLTLLVIAGGALIGDFLSYELGRRYGYALFRRPFFAKRQGLVQKGGAFFKRHGGKGLVAAHLLGPLRPLVPAIAGAYGLSRLRFGAAIVPAAAIWTLSYVLPGVAFGASLGLAAEVTRRLAIVILVLAIALWLALWITRRTVIAFGRNAQSWLNGLMDWSQRHGPIGRIGAALADPRQPELPALLAFGVVLLTFGAAAVALCWTLGGQPPNIDLYARDALQNLHDPVAVRLAAIALMPGDAAVYGSFAASLIVTTLLKRRWDVVRHLLATMLFALAVCLALGLAPGLRVTPEAAALHLSQDLALPIAIYGLVPVLYSGVATTINVRMFSYGLVAVVLLFVALARFYLCGLWLTTGLATLLVTTLWAAAVGVSFRRHGGDPLSLGSLWPVLAILLVALVLDSRSVRLRVQAAQPEMAPRQFASGDWWNNGWRRLPARRIDVAGRDKQYLNLQWAGALPEIRHALDAAGWNSPAPPTFANSLRWLASSGDIAHLPLMPRMHAGHYAVLTLRQDLDEGGQYLIRLWPSGYLLDEHTPLWIGTVTTQHAAEFFRLLRYPVSDDRYNAALAALALAPEGFESRDARRSPGSFTVRLLRPLPPAAPAPASPP